MSSEKTDSPKVIFQVSDYDQIEGTEEAENLIAEQRSLLELLLESDEYVEALDRVVNSLSQSGNILICNQYSHGNFLVLRKQDQKMFTRIKIAISHYISQITNTSPSEILNNIRKVKITQTDDEYGISLVFSGYSGNGINS